MTNAEIWKMCMDERKAEYEQLKCEIERVGDMYLKADFEEDMYYNLKERGSSIYREAFTEKHEQSKKCVDELEKRKEFLRDKIEVLQKEMEYIEGKLNRS